MINRIVFCFLVLVFFLTFLPELALMLPIWVLTGKVRDPFFIQIADGKIYKLKQ